MTDYVYVLRCVNEDMTSAYGFKWPTHGYVECPDWDPKPECGNGLHGFLWGEGDLEVANWRADSKWLVVKVNKDDVVDLDGKVKFPRGEVVFCGHRHDAANHIVSLGATGRVHFVTREMGNKANLVGGHYCSLKAGDDSTLTAGDKSTITAGHSSTLTAGPKSTLTAGDDSTFTAGDHSTLTAGHYNTLTAGPESTLKAGDCSTLTAGYNSTLTAGHGSTLTAGDDSTLTAGDQSTLTAGKHSTLTAGPESTITAGYGSTFKAGLESVLIGYCQDTGKRVMAMVGQDGILPNVTYKIKDGKFVPA